MKLKKILFSSLSCVVATSPIATIIACNDEVKVSDTNAYKGKTLSEDFKIPKGTKIIGEKAFWDAKLPDNFTIPEGVTTIKPYAFSGVTFPKNFQLPKSITTIEDGAFIRATFQTTFEWPKNIKELPIGIFDSAKFLHAENPRTFPDDPGVFIPEGITTFGKYSFSFVKFPAGFHVPTTLKNVYLRSFYQSDFTNLSPSFAFPKDMHYGSIKGGSGKGIFQDSIWENPKIDLNGEKIWKKYTQWGGRGDYAIDAFLRGHPTFDPPGPDYEKGTGTDKDIEYDWLFHGKTSHK